MKRLYEPIAIYKYNEIKYFIAIDEGNVVYFKYENGEISKDYSKEELKVFWGVYNSLKVDKKNACNLGIKSINGKSFETFYDIEKEVYFWYEIIDGHRCNVTKEDLKLLNYKYNNQCLTLFENDDGVNEEHDENVDPYNEKEYSFFFNRDPNDKVERPEIYDWATDSSIDGDKKQKRPSTFTRVADIAGKTIFVVVVAGISMISLSDNPIRSNIVEKIEELFTETDVIDSNQEYGFEIIEQAIKENNNLSEGEKSFFLKTKPYFEDLKSYMDLKAIAKRISNLRIEYAKDACEAPYVDGKYSIKNNIITMYSSESFEKCDKTMLLHEFFHVTQKGFTKRFTMELSDEVATREYLRILVEENLIDKSEFVMMDGVPYYGCGYDQCVDGYYLLMNLLDEDTIRKYQAVPTDAVLVDALVEIEKNAGAKHTRSYTTLDLSKNAIELLDLFDDLREDPDEHGYCKGSYTDEKYKKICDALDYYYQVKFGKTIDECFVEDIMSYDKTCGEIVGDNPKECAVLKVMEDALDCSIEDSDKKYNKPMGNTRFVVPRTYFSDRYENPIIYYSVYKAEPDLVVYSEHYINTEITPEMNVEFEKQFEIAKKEMADGDIKDTADSIEDINSGEGERD